MKNYTLAVIGCGNMAQAIIKALRSERISAELKAQSRVLEIFVSDTDSSKTACVSGNGIHIAQDNDYAVKNCDYVLLAVKPQYAHEILKPLDLKNKVIISIMAGIKIQTLKEYTGSDKIVRVMPNLNARVYQSFNAYTCCGLSDNEHEFVRFALGSFGQAEEIKEEGMNAVTGLTGSSPAYVFMFIKSFIETGVSLGFSYDTARNMALSAVIGSAETVKADKNADLERLIESVCSKGGTTIEGVNYLHDSDFEKITATAILKAVKRAEELSESK